MAKLCSTLLTIHQQNSDSKLQLERSKVLKEQRNKVDLIRLEKEKKAAVQREKEEEKRKQAQLRYQQHQQEALQRQKERELYEQDQQKKLELFEQQKREKQLAKEKSIQQHKYSRYTHFSISITYAANYRSNIKKIKDRMNMEAPIKEFLPTGSGSLPNFKPSGASPSKKTHSTNDSVDGNKPTNDSNTMDSSFMGSQSMNNIHTGTSPTTKVQQQSTGKPSPLDDKPMKLKQLQEKKEREKQRQKELQEWKKKQKQLLKEKSGDFEVQVVFSNKKKSPPKTPSASLLAPAAATSSQRMTDALMLSILPKTNPGVANTEVRAKLKNEQDNKDYESMIADLREVLSMKDTDDMDEPTDKTSEQPSQPPVQQSPSPAKQPQPNPMELIIMGDQLPNLPNVKQDDSLYYRIESLRLHLEEQLGEETFIKAYKLLKDLQEQDDDDVLTEQLVVALGDKVTHLPLIHQLIYCEDKFFAGEHTG